MAKSKQSEEELGQQGFLNRWSERKQSTKETKTESEKDPQKEDLIEGQAVQETGATTALSEEEIAALPDPATLTENSDFTLFLQEGVPENLKRLALRRLWRVNPIIGEVDGLLDYDLDYTDAATVVKNLKTLYQVGKGMVLEEETAEEDEGESGKSDEEEGVGAVAETSPAGTAESEASADQEGEDQVSDFHQSAAGSQAVSSSSDAPASAGVSDDAGRMGTGDIPLDLSGRGQGENTRFTDRSADLVPVSPHSQEPLPEGADRPVPERSKTALPGQAVRRRWGGFS